MKKFWISCALSLSIAASGLPVQSFAAEADDVPLRSLVEQLNGTLGWDAATRSIEVNVGNDKGSFKLDSMDASIKGQAVKLDKKPYLQNGSTLVSAATAAQIKEAFKKADKLLFSFSTVGDSRTEPNTWDVSAQDNKWLVNSKVMTRMANEMRGQQSKMLFFNGDMIMGYTPNSDVNVLNRQYAFWRGLASTIFENGMYVFPVAGNHEVQDRYTDEKGKTVKKATKANEDTWRDNMEDVIIDEKRFAEILGEQVTGWDPSNTPKIGMDNITTDQKQLSYSFDYKGSHFAIINTDPAGNDSHAPTAWLNSDLDKAKARGMKHSFVFGHKMAYYYQFDPANPKSDGLEVDKAAADAFWKVIQDHNATYFSGHEHIFNISQPNGGKAYQVLVGSGGSPFEATKPTGNPTDRMYAWVTVKVYESGKVHIDAYGFDAFFGPTQNIKSWDLENGF
ncbi:stalk domain-containing protein [Paenibacillus filicis]|uniref:Stalk domain-containing protein n=1 Tax=Paenibacillus gyeongsangnamensis TaxID=3388067 RepID=A0ABT4Q9Q3_9BACL|nr:stalk domain-containing protein [Paenibacillus filicis]MCZ8513611.1 stalk domain-containing protein [Paenibacillus filicis]